MPATAPSPFYEKWQHFCPERPLKEDLLDFIDQHFFPARYQLVTDLIDYGENALYTGLVGHCTFGLGRQVARIHPEHARQVNLLAGFAFYAGVGQKTTMGMGQCMQSRVWNPDELLREVGK
ncbi:MAG: CRISPR system precrRNA processing endoribonuclease RAMP protein Cas6 [Moorella sp. (in: Bacteria)]|nr:CRISPR system precrRNA processing endoribonuclease RAMP protein Cas6 [Moorella sp. (in: firmicutes)]